MELLERHFESAFDAPNGTMELRKLILSLGVQGKLTPSRPDAIPTRTVSLKKITTKIGSGSTPAGGKQSYSTSGIPLIRSMNVHFGGFKEEGLAFITQEQADKLSNVVVHEADVLLNITGASIGRVTIAPPEMEGARVNQHVCIIRPCSDVNPSYLEKYLASPLIQHLIATIQVGATREALTKAMIEQFNIPLPSKEEQSRIVARIDELMARCDALEKLRAERDAKRLAVHSAAVRQLMNVADTKGYIQAREFLSQHFGELYTVKENVTELRKAILQLAVMGKLVPQDPNDPPASELLKQIETEKKRLVEEGRLKQPLASPPVTSNEVQYCLPHEWELTRLDQLLTFGPTNGTSPQSVEFETKTRSLTLSATTSGKFKGEFQKFVDIDIPEDSDLWLKDGDILVQRGNTIEYVGVPAVYKGPPFTYIYPDLMMKIRVSSKVDVDYIYYAMSSDISRNYLRARATGTSGTMPKINQETLRNLPLPLPPLVEQRRIAAKIEQLMRLCDTLEQQIDSARMTQSALLNAVMAEYGGQRCA